MQRESERNRACAAVAGAVVLALATGHAFRSQAPGGGQGPPLLDYS
jgi:hypothetical protein